MAIARGVALDGVLVRFGEIAIKSAPVRGRMLGLLHRNLLDAMAAQGVEGGVERRGPRLWMVGSDLEALAGIACRTFGVVSASPAQVVPAAMPDICGAAAALALSRPFRSFAIRARREGRHAFSSQDVQVQAGAAVHQAATAAGRQPEVDLDTPDLEVHVDIRDQRAYVFLDRRPGPGGLPIGCQGSVVVLLSDEASAVAAWLLARRGCTVRLLHAGDTGSLPTDAVAELARWGLPRDVEVLPVCTGAVTKRTLLEAACRIAREARAVAVATGETLGSALLQDLPGPVLRPVCGLAPREYGAVRDRLGLAPMGWPDPVLAEASREDVASLLSMRRTVMV
jgi:thiamine biosynthesis protein ThiI